MSENKATKEQYEKFLNEFFGTEIKWSKLSKKELMEFMTSLDNTEEMIIKHFDSAPDQRNAMLELGRNRVKTIAMDTGSKLLKNIDEKRPILNLFKGMLSRDKSE